MRRPSTRRLDTLLLATLGGLCFSGCGGSSPADRREETRRRAFELIAAKKPIEAEALLRPLLLENETPDPEADRALTTLYMEAYHFNAALAVIERWLKDDPTDPRPALLRADIHARADEAAETLVADYREALRRDPNQAEARLGLADALRRAGMFEEALRAYDDSLRLKPNDSSAHLGAARAASGLDQVDEALKHLDRALELDSTQAPAYAERSSLRTKRGDLAGALADLDKAVEIDPYEPEARYKRSLLLGRLGQVAKARADQERAKILRADNAKMAEIRNALVAKPDDPALHCEAARWLIEHGHADEGIVWAKKALVARPGDANACRILAEHYERNGAAGLANFYRSQTR